MILPEPFFQGRQLDTLVENKTSYSLKEAEVHVYETHQMAERILLRFDYPVLASMIEGKKVMHLRENAGFDFLPGESVMLPAGDPMCIDFPEAHRQNPTRCMALTLSDELISQVTQLMNETMPRADQLEWKLMQDHLHFTNDEMVYPVLQRLLYLFAENHPMKDLFIENMLREVLIRILQTNSRQIYTQQTRTLAGTHRLAYVIQFIRTHLDQPLTVDLLSKKACMSKSHFFRVFKDELGVSPVDFILQERITRAVNLLRASDRSIKQVYLDCGFESRSYFNRVFKRYKKVSPREFQLGLTANA
jgi:AraC family transcriptional regulator